MECRCAESKFFKVSKKIATTKYMMPVYCISNEVDQALLPSLSCPCSIVRSFEEIVSVFAQQPRDEDRFSVMTDNILFVAELVSWIAC